MSKDKQGDDPDVDKADFPIRKKSWGYSQSFKNCVSLKDIKPKA